MNTIEIYFAVRGKLLQISEYYQKITNKQDHMFWGYALFVIGISFIASMETINSYYESRTAVAMAKLAETEAINKQKIELAKIAAHANPQTIIFQSITDKSVNVKIVEEQNPESIVVNGIRYSEEQTKLLKMAFEIGNEFGFPETLQSLLLQETHAGAYGDRIGDTNLPVGKRSYGVMQMKVATSRKVMKKYPELVKQYFPNRKTLRRIRDEEIIVKLITDDEFNIRLAAYNFKIHDKLSKNWAQAVVAYNTGQGAANKIASPREHDYYVKIVKRLKKEVRPFNKKAGLEI